VHLGVTEAGNGDEARIKSATGIGSLLASGIGDTIRVSLAEAPEAEIPVARKLVDFYARSGKNTGRNQPEIQRISGDNHTETLKMYYSGLLFDELLIRAAVDFTLAHQQKRAEDVQITNQERTDTSELKTLGQNILQALGIRHFKTEFIACPSCGRTQFNLMEALEKVKKQTSHLKNLSIAVMGCMVNGPGEMAGADYGYVGAAPGKVTIYKGSSPILKNIDEKNAVQSLIDLIKQEGDWVKDNSSA
jgi:(E)-4-hydroxy-3-methylbut-2-enyl-diphosphate synthase